MSDYNYRPIEHELAGGTSANEGHTCIDINNEATHQDCEACRTESLLADETYCTECNRPANTECVEQGHRVSYPDCAECGGPAGEGYQQHKASCSFTKQNYNPLPAPRAGERDDIAYRAVAYLVCDGIVNPDKYYPPDIAAWARDLMVNEQRVGITLIRETVEQYNQHSTLIEQRERLISALLNAKRCLDRPDRSQLSVRKAIAKADEALATIEQEGEA